MTVVVHSPSLTPRNLVNPEQRCSFDISIYTRIPPSIPSVLMDTPCLGKDLVLLSTKFVLGNPVSHRRKVPTKKSDGDFSVVQSDLKRRGGIKRFKDHSTIWSVEGYRSGEWIVVRMCLKKVVGQEVHRGTL